MNNRWNDRGRLGLCILGVLAGSSANGQTCAPGGGGTDPGSVGRNVPGYLSAWETKYPTSTLPDRMQAQTGSACFVCHHPPSFNTAGNCYRDGLTTLLGQGMAIEQAIDQLDGQDSDGDGFNNGYEATLPRPEAGEVGYNMGLVGATGTDPCGSNPSEVVTGVPETPPVDQVPAFSFWGFVVLAGTVLGGGVLIFRRIPRGALAG